MSIKTLAALAGILAAAPLAAQTPIAAGQTVTGTLDEGDRQTDDGALYDAYVIRGRPGDRLVVRMRSADFDTYLHWGYAEGDEWVEEGANDDFGPATDSRLVVRLDEEGKFELRAAAFEADEGGEYDLQVAALGEPATERIRAGQTVQGELNEADFEGEDGLEDHYLIEGQEGEAITIFVESEEFDTFVSFGPGDVGARLADTDDDGGRGTNSELVVRFGPGREHAIRVRSFSGDEIGAYTLRVVQGEASENWDDDGDEGEDWDDGSDDEEYNEDLDVDVDVDAADFDVDVMRTDTVVMSEDFSGMGWTVLPIEAGETVEGRLDDEDPRTGEGDFYQDFVYQARAGERLTILASSGEIDPYVFIGRGPDAEMEALSEDDDSGPGTDSELTFTVPESGEYVIRIAAAIPGQTGAYRLRVQSSR